MKKYLLLWCIINLISIASITPSSDDAKDNPPIPRLSIYTNRITKTGENNLIAPEDLPALTKVLFLFMANSGSAFPIGNNLNILGGTGITTTAEQSTVSINATGTFADSFVTDSGTAIPSSNTIDIHGGSNINTSGSGSTVTINLNNSPSVSGSVTAGTGLIATTGGINATGNSSITGGTITLNSGTHALNISTDAAATTVAIADGVAAKTVTVGSTSGASSLELQAGSGGISLVGTATATTQAANDDSTKLATTAYIDNSNPYRLLSTQTISSAASVQFINLPTTYTNFQVKWYGVVPATTGEALALQFSGNNGSSWITTGGYYGGDLFSSTSSPTGAFNVSSNADYLQLSQIIQNTANYGCSGELNITNIGLSQGVYPCAYGRATYLNSTTPVIGSCINGGYVATIGCNAFRLIFASGNILSGTFKLYAVS